MQDKHFKNEALGTFCSNRCLNGCKMFRQYSVKRKEEIVKIKPVILRNEVTKDLFSKSVQTTGKDPSLRSG